MLTMSSPPETHSLHRAANVIGKKLIQGAATYQKGDGNKTRAQPCCSRNVSWPGDQQQDHGNDKNHGNCTTVTSETNPREKNPKQPTL